MNLKLAYITNKYINYLRNYDNKVFYNKGQTRPYLGVLFDIGETKYYAPLSSPKEKHKNLKENISIIKIENGELGVIYLNNMIPVISSEIIPLNLNNILEKQYKSLLTKQIRYIEQNEERIIKKANKLYKLYQEKKLYNLNNLCCNFKYLEEKSIQFKK